MRLGRQEVTPRRPSSTGCRIDAFAVGDPPHGRGADLVPEAGELAVDPSVSPQLGFSVANRMVKAGRPAVPVRAAAPAILTARPGANV